MRIAMTLLVGALALAGCKKKDPEPSASPASGQTTTAAGSAAGAAAHSAAAVAPDQAMQKGAGNCPSTVAGATTSAALEGAKVVVTIVATDKDAIAAIQKRAAEVVQEKAGGVADGAPHDARGSHGGGRGLCPIHLGGGATAQVASTDAGVVVTITPGSIAAAALEAEIQARIVKAADWVKANVKEGDHGTTGGVGGGKGEHGSDHSGEGDGKGQSRKDGGGSGGGGGKGDGTGGGKGDGTGGGGGGGGSGSGGSGGGGGGKAP